MSDSLITQESSKLIQDVRSFLETVVEVTINDEIQKKNVITLGNELQKKFRVIEDARKTEKGIWDKKAAAVQAEFKPILDLISNKKSILASAVSAYDHQIELKRQDRQRQLDNAARREREALETFAGKREERLKMYQGKLAETQAKMDLCRDDAQAFNTLLNQARYLSNKVEEFTEKMVETQQQAAKVTAPIYQPETPTASAGTRKVMEARYSITDMKAFVSDCVERDECHLLLIDDANLKQRIKETEGKISRRGLECSWTAKTSFSGR